nr:PREDICTED: uncharacterized protein LOC104956923 [Notothenia coriiceps]
MSTGDTQGVDNQEAWNERQMPFGFNLFAAQSGGVHVSRSGGSAALFCAPVPLDITVLRRYDNRVVVVVVEGETGPRTGSRSRTGRSTVALYSPLSENMSEFFLFAFLALFSGLFPCAEPSAVSGEERASARGTSPPVPCVRALPFEDADRPFSYAQRLLDAASRWLQPGVRSAEEVVGQVALEQLIAGLPSSTANWVQCHRPAKSSRRPCGGPPLASPAEHERGAPTTSRLSGQTRPSPRGQGSGLRFWSSGTTGGSSDVRAGLLAVRAARPLPTGVSSHGGRTAGSGCRTGGGFQPRGLWDSQANTLDPFKSGWKRLVTVLACSPSPQSLTHAIIKVNRILTNGRTPTVLIDALTEIVDTVQGRIEIYLDGGIRTGSDVLKALALGAKCVFIGRPAVWGLAYKGDEGVREVLQILNDEFRLSMALSGCRNVAEINRNLIQFSKL